MIWLLIFIWETSGDHSMVWWQVFHFTSERAFSIDIVVATCIS